MKRLTEHEAQILADASKSIDWASPPMTEEDEHVANGLVTRGLLRWSDWVEVPSDPEFETQFTCITSLGRFILRLYRSLQAVAA